MQEVMFATTTSIGCTKFVVKVKDADIVNETSTAQGSTIDVN